MPFKVDAGNRGLVQAGREMIERKRHLHAYEVYRDLGHRRSYRETARQVSSTATSVGKWAKIFEWEKRIKAYGLTSAKRKEAGAILKVDDPIAQKTLDAMEKVEALIDSAFIQDIHTGRPSPTFKIKTAEDLTKLVNAYRQFLETYHRFVATHMPEDKAVKKVTNIKEFNVNLENMSQEERIAIMEKLTNGNDVGGNKQPEGRVQDADFEQVSERGDEDGPGCEGVPGSPTSSSSGDESTVRKS